MAVRWAGLSVEMSVVSMELHWAAPKVAQKAQQTAERTVVATAGWSAAYWVVPSVELSAARLAAHSVVQKALLKVAGMVEPWVQTMVATKAEQMVAYWAVL